MSDQPEQSVYNNKRFKVRHYNFDLFVGPTAGQPLRDYTLTDLETGAAVKLSDYHGKWLVLETGSSTCSMYTKNIDGMAELRADFPDVEFAMIYTREAHPGERLGAHQSMNDKLTAAKMVTPRYGEHRRVLVDNLEGDFHRAYGMMPNMLYIFRPDGTVHYRCNWAATHYARAALEDRENYHHLENADKMALRASRKLWPMVRTMWTGGILALWDFLMGAPHVVARHTATDEFYAKHGRFKQQEDEIIPEDGSETEDAKKGETA